MLWCHCIDANKKDVNPPHERTEFFIYCYLFTSIEWAWLCDDSRVELCWVGSSTMVVRVALMIAPVV